MILDDDYYDTLEEPEEEEEDMLDLAKHLTATYAPKPLPHRCC